MDNGFFGKRHLIADKPARTPADIAGMTVRVPPNQMWIETFKAMGARPTTVQWSEIYNALQQNVVQAAEAPLGSLWGSKLHETRKVLSMTGHFTAFAMWPINTSYFGKLPADVQKVLLEEGRRAGAEMTRLTLAMEKDYLAKMKGAGMTCRRCRSRRLCPGDRRRLQGVPEVDAGPARDRDGRSRQVAAGVPSLSAASGCRSRPGEVADRFEELVACSPSSS